MLHRGLIVAALLFTCACEKREPTLAEREAAARANAAEKRAEADVKRAERSVEAAEERKEQAEARLDHARDRADEFDGIDLGDERDAKDVDRRDAWVRFARGDERTAERGEYSLERGDDGSIATYRRTKAVGGAERDDDAIERDVNAKINANDKLRAMNIDVGADDRVVTLKGKVRSASDASTAVRLALGVRGVEKVVSRLTFEAAK